jgi:hypothetical protein
LQQQLHLVLVVLALTQTLGHQMMTLMASSGWGITLRGTAAGS